MVPERLSVYLHPEIKLPELVAWAEEAMQEEEFSPERFEAIREVVNRLGVADVRVFGLTWDHCEQFLGRLGYSARIKVVAH